MDPRQVIEVQRLYPQIYLACHVDHVRQGSTEWRLSSRDSSLLAHLDRDCAVSPRELAAHLGVGAPALSASIARLQKLGYITSTASANDKRQRELRLTDRGAEAMASTSVLDGARVAAMLEQLDAREREEALRGLALLAKAARAMKGDACESH
jgi:DNA-binding MarR family transcriptional regulator